MIVKILFSRQYNLLKGQFEFKEGLDIQAKDLIEKLMKIDEKERLGSK